MSRNLIVEPQSLTFRPRFLLKPGDVMNMLETAIGVPSDIILVHAYTDGSFMATVTNDRACRRILKDGFLWRNNRIRFNKIDTNIHGFLLLNLPANISDDLIFKYLRCYGKVLVVDRVNSNDGSPARRVYIDLSRDLPSKVYITGKYYNVVA